MLICWAEIQQYMYRIKHIYLLDARNVNSLHITEPKNKYLGMSFEHGN
jgi:hypothetical protein